MTQTEAWDLFVNHRGLFYKRAFTICWASMIKSRSALREEAVDFMTDAFVKDLQRFDPAKAPPGRTAVMHALYQMPYRFADWTRTSLILRTSKVCKNKHITGYAKRPIGLDKDDIFWEQIKERPVQAASTVDKDDIRILLRKLHRKPRLIMQSYFLDGLTMKEASQVHGVTESRVCQIINDGIKELRRLANEEAFV